MKTIILAICFGGIAACREQVRTETSMDPKAPQVDLVSIHDPVSGQTKTLAPELTDAEFMANIEEEFKTAIGSLEEPSTKASEQDAVAAKSQMELLEGAVKRIETRRFTRVLEEVKNTRAELDMRRAATTKAYRAAADFRLQNDIVDPDPESLDVAVSLSNSSATNDTDYIRLKKTYLDLKAEQQKLETEFSVCRLTRVDVAYMNKSRTMAAVTELCAALVEESRMEAAQVYQAADVFRQKNKITDSDPEMAGAAISPSTGPLVADYLRLKKTYLEIKAECESADLILPIDVLQSEVDTAENEMVHYFGELTEFFNGGKVIDANPEDPTSEVSIPSNDKETESNYGKAKARYAASKDLVGRVRKALLRAKGRKEK